jgi:hypothetical protein
MDGVGGAKRRRAEKAALNHAVFQQDAFGGGGSGINPYGKVTRAP